MTRLPEHIRAAVLAHLKSVVTEALNEVDRLHAEASPEDERPLFDVDSVLSAVLAKRVLDHAREGTENRYLEIVIDGMRKTLAVLMAERKADVVDLASRLPEGRA